MEWWKRNNLRLIQTNLRATDAAADRSALIEQLKELSANVLLLNTGGLVAFYPTSLDFHYRSPFLGDGDLVGDMVELCHRNGIRFMARFDLSKIHESIYRAHPEWAYRSKTGEAINYNGMVHTCINSAYQRERSLDILKEAIDRYPVDGVFFNMFGYTTRDYSNRYHGICRCESCRKAFQERYGMELPEEENPEDPIFQKYNRFKADTVQEVLDSIRALIKGKSPDIAISTYTDYAVDIIKKESNTEIHRPYPVWEYSASENIQSVEGSWDDKIISNVCINAVGIDYRFMGVPKAQVALRLRQALAAGSGFDFCIIGVFADYPDRKSLSVVGDLYRFHQKNERYFGNFTNASDVLLIKGGPNPTELQSNEYLGLFRMLKESHVQFRVVEQTAFSVRHAEGAQAIVCPDLIPDERLLAALEAAGKPVVWTGTSWRARADGRFLAFFSVAECGATSDKRWGYLLNTPKSLFPHLKDTDWTMLDGPSVSLAGKDGCGHALEELSAGRFGPPELCGGNLPTGRHALLVDGKRRTMLFAFHPGGLYKRYGYDEHKHLVMDALLRDGWVRPVLTVDAPEYVEVYYGAYADSCVARYTVQLINLTGFNGSSFHEPCPVRSIGIRIVWSDSAPPTRVRSLVSESEVPFSFDGSHLAFSVGELAEYEAIVIS